ncbi:MAG: endo-1,4-beta-xylanase [Tepidisphaeraceae bacterium]
MALVSQGTTQAEAPPGEALLSADPAAFKMAGGDLATRSVINVAGESFEHANAVTVQKRPGAEYEVQLTQPVKRPLASGDVLLLTVWARLQSTPDESNEGRIGFVVEQQGGKSWPLQRVFGVGKTWRRFDMSAVVDEASGPGAAAVNLRLGYYVQSLEIGGVSLQRFPQGTPLASLPNTKPTYLGRAADAPWRAAAANRIDKIRKAALTLQVVDAAGRPVPDAAVHVRMTRHSFAFGSVYDANLVAGSESASRAAAVYRRKYLELFNTGVDELKMKWPWWDDPSHRQAAIDSVQWMRQHNVDVRGHVLVWPSWRKTPPDLKAFANDPAGLRQKVIDHIDDEGKTFKGQLSEWDVVNEPILNNDLLKILGANVMADWFKEAHRIEPNARLYLNEAGVPNSIPGDARYDKFCHNIEVIQKNGGPIGGIGMQGHFGWTMNSPEQLLSIYDCFSRFGVPIRLTELDIDVSDPDLQHDYMRDVLTATFSHPSVNGILNWSFWAGASWKPQAALFDKEWHPTAAGRAWTDLIQHQWWTDLKGKTSTDGTFQCRGFLGDYEITAQSAGRSVKTSTKIESGEQFVRLQMN